MPVKKYRSSLKIEIQFLVNRFNEHQIPQMRKLAAGYECSLKLKSMQIISIERYWNLAAGREEIQKI